jgi:hypothetical protein
MCVFVGNLTKFILRCMKIRNLLIIDWYPQITLDQFSVYHPVLDDEILYSIFPNKTCWWIWSFHAVCAYNHYVLGRVRSPPRLYLRCVTLVWMDEPLYECGRLPSPWCVAVVLRLLATGLLLQCGSSWLVRMVLLSLSDLAFAPFATQNRRIAIGTLCSVSAFIVPFCMEFMKFDIWVFFENLSRKFRYC